MMQPAGLSAQAVCADALRPAGTGYTVMHCHLQPHTDEGCMMKIHIVQQTCAPRALELRVFWHAASMLSTTSSPAQVVLLVPAWAAQHDRAGKGPRHCWMQCIHDHRTQL